MPNDWYWPKVLHYRVTSR